MFTPAQSLIGNLLSMCRMFQPQKVLKPPLGLPSPGHPEPGPNIQPRVSLAVLPFVQRMWTCPGACSCGFLCRRPGLMLVTGCG